jgi:hypothetical protein
MSDLRQNPHFVRRGELPEINAATPVRQVYAHLSSAGRSGFFLEEGGEVTAYVRAHDLATALFPDAPGGAAIGRAALTSQPIGEVLREVPGFSVPVEVRLVLPDAELEPLQDRDDAVFPVMAPTAGLAARGHGFAHEAPAGAELVVEGWLLNHETLMATSTRKTVWKCINDHENPDPDHGTCYRCPFPTRPVDA